MQQGRGTDKYTHLHVSFNVSILLSHIEWHQLLTPSRTCCHCCLFVHHFRIQTTNNSRLSKDSVDTTLLVPDTEHTQLSPMSSSSSSTSNSSNPPPACLSRAQVAELRMAVALVVIRQRQTKRRQQQQEQQGNHVNTNSTSTTLQDAPRQRRRRQEQDNHAAGSTMTDNNHDNTTTTMTRAHVHHLMEIAVTQSQQQQQLVPTTGLLLHLSQTWQLWIARDGPQPAAALLDELWQVTHTNTSRMVALCSVYQTMVGLLLLQNNNGNHGLVHVLEQSIRGVLSAHGALGAGQNNSNDDLDRLFLLISLWEFCLQQQPPQAALDDPAMPATGLLPADLHRQWKATAGSVNALWIRHAVGMARQRSAAPQYQRATTTSTTE